MDSAIPLTRDVVLIGGGHTHALVLRKWGMRPLPGARLTLINPAPSAPYTGMLPGHVAGHYGRDALEIDLVRLARFAGARLVIGAATGIDRETRHITVPGRPPIRYDIASVDIGITSAMPELEGFADHAVAAKPLGPFAGRWADFVVRVEGGEAAPRVAIIGGGVGGCELAMAMAHRLRDHQPSITVVEASEAILRDVTSGTRAAVRREMVRLGVHVRTGAEVRAVTADGLTLGDGTMLDAGFVTGAAGARPHGWLGETGLALEDGFIAVDETLRSSDPSIYAVGDCAYLSHAPRVKAGVYAVRQAPFLHHNLRADLTGGQRRPYRPQKDYLKLISTGGKRAIADRSGLTVAGDWLWRWKDRIDRKFMDQFTDLRPMAPAPLPATVTKGVRAEIGDKLLCGGCGAKVDARSLRGALAALPAPSRKDVLQGAGDDAAILKHGRGAQVFTTDHFRAFIDDPVTLTRIAAVHAMGDIWAMGGAPQAGLLTVILPRMADDLASATMTEILATAEDTLRAAGADLVGGHSSVGAELTVGFAMTGLVEKAIGIEGARAGDALILTKPIGSGTIMAGEMQLEARGAWVASALDHMAQAQGTAATILAPHAHAMTDVTGFGLAGHLSQMMVGAGLSAALDLSALPLMDGAEALAAQGVRSTLWEKNRAAAPVIAGAEGARGALLFDPQTAGGLLAAVPGGRAETLLAELHGAGYSEAAIIGRAQAGAVPITLC
ncbi:MAG: selenide, water dikinase SelD [Rubricella sp.]